MQEDRRGKERLQLIARGTPYIRAEKEDQIPVTRAEQHDEDICCCRTDKTTRRRYLLFYGQIQHAEEKENTGIRPVRREIGEQTRSKIKKKGKKESTTSSSHHCRFRAPPIELNENKQTKQKLPLVVEDSGLL